MGIRHGDGLMSPLDPQIQEICLGFGQWSINHSKCGRRVSTCVEVGAAIAGPKIRESWPARRITFDTLLNAYQYHS